MSLCLSLQVSRWQSASLCYRHILLTSFTRSPTVSAQLSHRNYASKNKAKSTATFIPGSKQPITNEAAREEYAKAENAMSVAVDWFRKECAASEARVLGRVTPALLSPVRVKVPGMAKSLQLEEVATVGVREGTNLLITLFDEHVRFLRFFVSSFFLCWL
jgi:ribosome recycling factor